MSARIIASIGIAIAAAALGYFVGKPAATGSPEPAEGASGSQRPGASATATQSELAKLVDPMSIDELPDEIASWVSAALDTAASDPYAAFLSLKELEGEAERAEAAFQLVGGLSAEQIRDFVSEVIETQTGDPDRRDELEDMFESPLVLFAMFDRWAQLDADGVAEFALEPMPEGDESMEIGLIMRVFPLALLARIDPDRAYEVAGKMSLSPMMEQMEEEMGGSMIDMFIGFGMGLSDPAAALRTMREREVSIQVIGQAEPIFEMAGARSGEVLAEIMLFPAGEERQAMLRELYRSWGEHDLGAAIESMQGLAEEDGREKMLENALVDTFESGARSDPQGAIQYLEMLTGEGQRERMAEVIVQRWAREDPAEALRWGQGELGDNEFAEQVRQASESLSPADGKEFVEEMSAEQRNLFFGASRGMANHFVVRMAQDDPVGTLAWLREQGGLASYGGAHFLGNGIESAVALADSLGADDPWAIEYRSQVAREAGRTGDRDWIDWAREQGGNAHDAAVSAWAAVEPEAAAEYAITQGEHTLIGAATRNWAEQDPAAAYRWTVEYHDGDPEAISNVLTASGLAGSWGRSDPGAAAVALSGFPDDSGAPFMGEVIRGWAAEEPGRASEFIAENLEAEGPMRDAAVVGLIDEIRGHSPQEARVWAESIADEERRTAVLESIDQGEN